MDGRLFVGERSGGVPPTTVAEWAGHSLKVLLRIYPKCLDGNDALVRRRVEAALMIDSSPDRIRQIGMSMNGEL